MTELALSNVPQAIQNGMMDSQKIQATQDQHTTEGLTQQLRAAQIADANYQQQVTKTTALGEDAYAQGQNSDAFKSFKTNNPGIAGQIADNHAMMDSKKVLLQTTALKDHATAVANTLTPIRTIADYNANYKAINGMMGEVGMKAPDPTSFKTDQDVSDWVDETNGKAIHAIKMGSASGKYIQDRIELIREKGADSPEVKALDADHQKYLDNQQVMHTPKTQPTGVIPPSATKAIDAELTKSYGDNLSAEDKQAMIGTAGPIYMKYIHSGLQPDAAMAAALSDTKKGITTESHIFGDSTKFDPTLVTGQSRPSQGAAPSAKTTAPASAIAYLKAHPEAKADFKAKYGYLPN